MSACRLLKTRSAIHLLGRMVNVVFYRGAWPWIKEDIYKLVTKFYISGTFPDPINTTEIVLIPKKANAKHVTDYRPISLTI